MSDCPVANDLANSLQKHATFCRFDFIYLKFNF